ncbi:MAG TPA: metallophosphoesterase [Vicinamibacterales bacterium]|nr:metallophosphoesterase [Vicinamibacterales bacterium]
MRTVVHLSDLHFGRADAGVAAVLLDEVRRLSPDVVAVSGDLTQRARRRQFRQARAFLHALPHPCVIVPGNHDVPLYNVFARFLDPLGGFRKTITSNLQPSYASDELVVAGINTTRSLTISDGRVRPDDLAHVRRVFDASDGDIVKVVVGHHPFDDAAHVELLTAFGTDVFLTGHLHLSYTGGTAARYTAAGRSAIVVEAGTAISTRMRGEANAFNVLRIERDRIVVATMRWQEASGRFGEADARTFNRADDGWRAAGAE